MPSGFHVFRSYVATDVPLSFDNKYETAHRQNSSSATVTVALAASGKLKCNQHLHECATNKKSALSGGTHLNDSHWLQNGLQKMHATFKILHPELVNTPKLME